MVKNDRVKIALDITTKVKFIKLKDGIHENKKNQRFVESTGFISNMQVTINCFMENK